MWALGLLCLLLAWVQVKSTTYDFSTGSCVTLTGSRLTNPCVGVVTYKYFLPSGTTAASLASTASISLNSSVISSTPTACQSAYVSYICGNLYLKCKPDVDLSNSTTYNYDIYSKLNVTFGVPYLRPCYSVCTNLTSYCTLTGKLLTYPTKASCNSATYDYSQGSSVSSSNPNQYQVDNDVAKCYIPLSVTLSGAKETYDSTFSNAICTGFVSSFYVPPANKINSAYTALQTPYTVQKMLNTLIYTSVSKVKSYVSDQCMIALLKRLCYSYFLTPEDVTIRTALATAGTSTAILTALTSAGFPMTATVTVPSYPAYSYCTQYTTKCAASISAITSLAASCNQTATNTDGTVYRTFPSNDQTIATASKSGTAVGTLSLTFVTNATSNAYYNATQYVNYHTAGSTHYDFSGGTCKTIGGTRFSNPCYGVVDYSYYLASGTTEASLIQSVSIKLNSSVIASMPMDCQTKLVRYVCATTFLKCKSGVSLSDSSTYNFDIYSPMSVTYGVPYLRPCGAVCTSLLPSCTLTGRLLTLPTPAQCVAERFDYSKGSLVSPAYPARYQVDNDATKCFSPNLVTLSGAKETYDTSLPNAVCKGLVGSFFIPPANKINPAFTSLQPPGVVQGLLNTALSTNFKSLKPWIGEDCMLALKKKFCYSVFLTPEDVTLRTALEHGGVSTAIISAVSSALPMTATVTIPSYPAYHYCTDFKEKCAALIAQAPQLDADCNATTTGTDGSVYRVFPSEDQTISTAFKSTAAGALYFKFKSNATSNAYYDSSTYSYTVDCPRGFSVPSDSTSKEVQIVGSSACAANCLLPIWTPDEWTQLINVSEKAPIIGVISSVLLMLFLAFTGELLNSHLITMYAVISLVVSAQSCNFHASAPTFEERVCYDETRYRSQDQGSSECVNQGIVIVYTFLAAVASLCLMSIEWAVRTSSYRAVVKQYWYFGVQFFVMFLLPIIPTAYAGANKYFGFSKSQGWCYIRSTPYAPDNLDVGLTALPLLIATLIAFVIVVVNSVFVLRASSKVGTDTDVPSSTIVGLPAWLTPADGTGETAVTAAIISLVFSIVFLFPFLARFGLQYSLRTEYYDAFIEWVQCIFTNYDGTDDSWIAACGNHVHKRPELGMTRMNTLVLTSHSIFVFPVFVVSYLLTYYYKGTHLRSNSPVPVQTRVVQVDATKDVAQGDAAQNKDVLTVAAPIEDDHNNKTAIV